MFTVLMLSHMMCIHPRDTPKSCSCFCMNRSFYKHEEAATYLVLYVDNGTKFCYTIAHDMRQDPKK